MAAAKTPTVAMWHEQEDDAFEAVSHAYGDSCAATTEHPTPQCLAFDERKELEAVIKFEEDVRAQLGGIPMYDEFEQTTDLEHPGADKVTRAYTGGDVVDVFSTVVIDQAYKVSINGEPCGHKTVQECSSVQQAPSELLMVLMGSPQ
ncbi:MAG TPA: hypothetical protein EYP98_01145 [Planctomycetes bacterium]|nr:hypothetical protein [Planctomycetota bacterium]